MIMDNIRHPFGKMSTYSFTNQSLLTGRGGGTIKPEAFLKHGGLDGCNVFMHDSLQGFEYTYPHRPGLRL